MKHAGFVLMVMWMAVAICSAQEPQPKPEVAPQDAQSRTEAKGPATAPLPTIDQVLDRCVDALGGRDAMEKSTSFQAKGSFDLPAMGTSGTVTVIAKAPNKWLMTIDVEGFGVMEMAYDGTTGWEKNPMVGLRKLAGKELVARKREAAFNKELKFKELYQKIEVTGRAKVADKDAYVVEATPADGSVEKLYFDAEGGLLVRHDAERESPQGPVLVELYFEDYRDVDGVKVPFILRQVSPQFTVQTKFNEVRHNVEIEDAKFSKPAA